MKNFTCSKMHDKKHCLTWPELTAWPSATANEQFIACIHRKHGTETANCTNHRIIAYELSIRHVQLKETQLSTS